MMKKILFLAALCMSVFMGGAVAAAAGFSAVLGGCVAGGASLASPLFRTLDCVTAGVYVEVWTGEAIKNFRTPDASVGWLNRIRSYDQYANNDVIHFVDIGGDPDVLINNTTYPIPVQAIADADKAIGLDKFQTKQTPITDDELYAISYDKMSSMIERHRDNIREKKYAKAIHALAPNGDSTATPVTLTTGATSSDGTHKMLTRQDVIAMKKKFDTAKVPVQGRVLVLCPDHVADLLENDQKFSEQYYNYTTGKISSLYGFEVYEYTECPYYTVSSKTKLPFAATAASGDRQASVAFYAPRMMKATGSTKMYHSEARTDPANQQNLINFRHYFICLPLRNEAMGAIVSAV